MKIKFSLFCAVCVLGLISACSSTTSQNNDNSVNSGASESTSQAAYGKPNLTAAGYNVALGIGYLKQGDMQRAKSKLLLALSQAPTWPQALDAMGYYLENTGDTRTAEVYYLKAVSISPNSGSVQNNYGTYLCRMGRYQEADQHFMLAVQDISYLNSAEAYENAGLCAMEVPDNNKAMYYFMKAVDQDPHRVTSVLELAQLYYKQRNYSEAQNYLNNYLSLIADPGPEALLLAIRLAHIHNDIATVGRDSLILQSRYPGSLEYKELRASPYLIPSTPTNDFTLGSKS